MTGEGYSGERLVTLDFIRGVAVLGILYANIVGFSQPMLAGVWPGALTVPMDGADRAAWWVQFLLIDGKMRGLFALLFGASLALFLGIVWWAWSKHQKTRFDEAANLPFVEKD